MPTKHGKLPTQPCNFRGTLRYASPNAHKKMELGRSDDLISLLYMMIEFFSGKLPWADTYNYDEILQLKLESIHSSLIQRMPPEFQAFEDHIYSLDYLDEPDYAMLTQLLCTVASKAGIDLNEPFEWEAEIREQKEIIQHKKNNGTMN
ncbi:MAG: putative Tau-tubulin kinase 1 [Streblomastix strix]|uniref:Putative Tau-tubulin kinase 1 n=1 Tax=Streblomastix strix TaxID=222440 RepID=A0A5J4WS76_9EUKA|nr:MAG: putative Tau-tubulin kinase 1 [Streblomastix strix]